jgi:hypothetical protein
MICRQRVLGSFVSLEKENSYMDTVTLIRLIAGIGFVVTLLILIQRRRRTH